MVPNVFPLFVFFGLMGFSGAELNFGTNIIASIALGVAVDDTIHIMMRLSETVRTTDDQEHACLRRYRPSANRRCMLLVLFLGFVTLGFSTFVPIREFGFLSAQQYSLAWLARLPCFLRCWRRHRLLRCGTCCTSNSEDPHKTIGLFANLRPSQAKIVALMGELKTYPRGQMIMRPGDETKAMFVVISGRAECR